MSLSDPDALECRLCGAEFLGPDRREQYRAHRQEQHPAGETPLAVLPAATPTATPTASLPETPRPFACRCGETFKTAHQVGGHVGARQNYPDGRKHERVAFTPKVSGQAVGKSADRARVTPAVPSGTDAATGRQDTSPSAPLTSDGHPERPAPDPPVTLTGGILTFLVSVDVAALPESLDAVVAAIRAALSGFGR